MSKQRIFSFIRALFLETASIFVWRRQLGKSESHQRAFETSRATMHGPRAETFRVSHHASVPSDTSLDATRARAQRLSSHTPTRVHSTFTVEDSVSSRAFKVRLRDVSALCVWCMSQFKSHLPPLFAIALARRGLHHRTSARNATYLEM